MCAAPGAEVPGGTQTLIVRLLKTHFFPPILNFEKSTEYNRVSDQTWGQNGGMTRPLIFWKNML